MRMRRGTLKLTTPLPLVAAIAAVILALAACAGASVPTGSVAPTATSVAPSTLTPSPTSSSIVNMGGNYTGTYMETGKQFTYSMGLELHQTGVNLLSHCTFEGEPNLGVITGTAIAGGKVTMSVAFSDGSSIHMEGTLTGPAGQGHMVGIWSSAVKTGTWDATRVG